MLGSEFKKIRIKSGYPQLAFGKLLGSTVKEVREYEDSLFNIPKLVEEALNKRLIRQDSSIQTDKVFSRRLFLKHMLTGNEVVDNIYKEAKWLREINRKPVYSRAATLFLKKIENNKEDKPIKVGVSSKEYFIPNRGFGDFICKKEWIE